MELVRLVLRQLNKPTLAKCTLLCRDWLELARPYLFESITYRARYFEAPFTRPDLGLPSDSRLPLDDFLDFLSQTPSVLGLVRHLRLSWKPHIPAMLVFASRGITLVPCRWETLLKLLHHLPRLRTLELADFPLESLGSDFETRPHCSVPIINHIESITFSRHSRPEDGDRSLRDVLHLLSAFRRVDKLRFACCYQSLLNKHISYNEDNAYIAYVVLR